MSKPQFPLCARCSKHACSPTGPAESTHVDMDNAPPFCPMKLRADVLKKVSQEYKKESVREFARQASIQEGECFEWADGKIRTKTSRST